MLQHCIGPSWSIGGKRESGTSVGLDEVELEQPKKQLGRIVEACFKPKETSLLMD